MSPSGVRFHRRRNRNSLPHWESRLDNLRGIKICCISQGISTIRRHDSLAETSGRGRSNEQNYASPNVPPSCLTWRGVWLQTSEEKKIYDDILHTSAAKRTCRNDACLRQATPTRKPACLRHRIGLGVCLRQARLGNRLLV